MTEAILHESGSPAVEKYADEEEEEDVLSFGTEEESDAEPDTAAAGRSPQAPDGPGMANMLHIMMYAQNFNGCSWDECVQVKSQRGCHNGNHQLIRTSETRTKDNKQCLLPRRKKKILSSAGRSDSASPTHRTPHETAQGEAGRGIPPDLSKTR